MIEKIDTQSAPKWQGITAVAALFGLVGGGVALVLYDYTFAGAVIVGGAIALVVAVFLSVGWRSPNPTGPVTPGSAGIGPGRGPGNTPKTPGADLGAMDRPAESATPLSSPAASTRQSHTDHEVEQHHTTEATVAGTAPAAAAAAGSTGSIGTAPASPPPAGAGDTPVPPAVGEGTKPEGLSAPRDGGPDNLKEIKGVGVKLEEMLHEMGYYHFDQIANWTPDEVAWVDQNLKGFRGRVTRDDWVPQAKILAAGGDTEFSKKVDKGDVY